MNEPPPGELDCLGSAPVPPRARITAAVLTRDEEAHLPACLASLRWADEVLVLDSGSKDATVEVARAAGARTAHHAFQNFSLQRQHALGLVTTPWVFFVDADERVPPALAGEARAAVAADGADAYWVPRTNLFWGHPMRGGGWWPDHQLRLLRVERASYDPDRAVHEVAHVRGTASRLTQPLVHLNYASLAEFRAKQATYARLEAERRRAAGGRVRAHNLVLQPWREFWRRYVALAGWRDGPVGLTVCALMAWYEYATLRAVKGPSRETIR